MTKKELEILRVVHSHLQMNNCAFDNIWADADDPLPQTEKEVTPFIRKRTELWRKTWVLPQLKGLISKYEQKFELRS